MQTLMNLLFQMDFLLNWDNSAGIKKCTEREPGDFRLHPDVYIPQDDDSCINCMSGRNFLVLPMQLFNGQKLLEL